MVHQINVHVQGLPEGEPLKFPPWAGSPLRGNRLVGSPRSSLPCRLCTTGRPYVHDVLSLYYSCNAVVGYTWASLLLEFVMSEDQRLQSYAYRDAK